MSCPRDSSDLTSKQCEALIAALDVRSRYLRRVLERMNRLHWSHVDRLYVSTVRVLEAHAIMRRTLEDLSTFRQAFIEPAESTPSTDAITFPTTPKGFTKNRSQPPQWGVTPTGCSSV